MNEEGLFDEFTERHGCVTVILAPDFIPQLTAGQMVDQAAFLKDIFEDRWPSVN